MTIPSRNKYLKKLISLGGTKIEQSFYSSLPRNHPPLGNPSTRSEHPKELGYVAASPESSKSVLVPSGTPLDSQLHCHQDLEYVLDWEHTFKN